MRLAGCVSAILVTKDGLNVSDIRFAQERAQGVLVVFMASNVRHVAHALAWHQLKYGMLEFTQPESLRARAVARAPSHLDD